MDRLNDFLPEACYTPQNLNKNDVIYAFLNKKTVVGSVIDMDVDRSLLLVQLGDNIIAELPFNEVTIYQYTYSKNTPEYTVPLQIATLKGKTICAKITSIYDEKVVLSRKRNMLEAFEVLKGNEMLPFLVTNTRPTHVYGDVGYGLEGIIYIRNLCKARIFTTSEILKKGDSIFVKLLSTEEPFYFNVSYRETFPEYDYTNYQRGDTLIGRVGNAVNNNSCGFFVQITPQVCGILDYDISLPLIRYGDMVECTISRATPKGLHLKFVKIVDNVKK